MIGVDDHVGEVGIVDDVGGCPRETNLPAGVVLVDADDPPGAVDLPLDVIARAPPMPVGLRREHAPDPVAVDSSRIGAGGIGHLRILPRSRYLSRTTHAVRLAALSDQAPVLIAPDSFKGTFTAMQVAEAVGRGLNAAGVPADLCPVADGGEGTMTALAHAWGADLGPRRSPIHSGGG